MARHSARRALLSVACEVHLESAVHALERDSSAGSNNWQICQLAGLIHSMHCRHVRAEAVRPVGQCIELARLQVQIWNFWKGVGDCPGPHPCADLQGTPKPPKTRLCLQMDVLGRLIAGKIRHEPWKRPSTPRAAPRKIPEKRTPFKQVHLLQYFPCPEGPSVPKGTLAERLLRRGWPRWRTPRRCRRVPKGTLAERLLRRGVSVVADLALEVGPERDLGRKAIETGAARTDPCPSRGSPERDLGRKAL